MGKLHPSGNSQYISKLNKIKVLNLIRERESISRADIAKESNISAPTVTRIVDYLINEEGLVKDVGEGTSSGGRKPTLIQFAAVDNYVIGIDLGKTHIDGVLANLNAEVIDEITIDTYLEDGFENIMNRIADLICDLSNNPKVKGKKIFGVGMAVAGLINKFEHIVEFSPNFKWKNVDIKKSLKEKCKLPIKFDNVTRVMALGEMWYGIGRYVKNFVVINWGYGIGSGIVINNEPLYGPKGMAGEFGHMTMDKDSKFKCGCGNYGCLEALASGSAISQRVKNEILGGKESILTKWINGDIQLINTKLICEAARQGDELASTIFDEAVEYLGIGISSLINLVSPECVLIGGGVAQSHDLIFSKIREIANKRTIVTKSKRVQIQAATFGMKAASKGAVALILNEVLNLNYSNHINKS